MDNLPTRLSDLERRYYISKTVLHREMANFQDDALVVVAVDLNLQHKLYMREKN